MAEGCGKSLPESSEACRTYERSDEIRVEGSSPREPYLSFTIGPDSLRRLVITIWSHDQENSNDQHETDQAHGNPHTSFALGVVTGSSDPHLRPDETDLCQVHKNALASTEKECHILEWRLNAPFEDDQPDKSEAQRWLESMSGGSCVEVGVFPLARHPDWVNVVCQVKVELYEDINKMLLPIEETHSPSCGPDIAAQLNNLAARLAQRYGNTKSTEDLTRAIKLAQKAIQASPIRHPNRPLILTNLGDWLSSQYDLTGSVEDLTTGVRVAEQAVKLTPDNHLSLAPRLEDLGHWLDRLYGQTKFVGHLMRAVTVREQAVEITPVGHPRLIQYLNNLAVGLRSRYEHTRSIGDMTRAIEMSRKAFEAAPVGYRGLAGILDNLGNSLGIRFRERGRFEDLAEAIETFERAVKTVPPGHPMLRTHLSHLGVWLGVRFEATGSIDDLERSIEVTNEAIENTPATDHSSLAMCLINLGICLGSRFEKRHSMDDLDKAIEVTERAIALIPEKHPHLAAAYNNLAKSLCSKSDPSALDRAIEVSEKAMAATSDKDLSFSIYSCTLGQALARRFEQTGSVIDLTKAIQASQKAAESTPIGHPNLPTVLSNLSSCLSLRYELIGSADDLTSAIQAAEKAVEITRHGDITLAGKLSNLGIELEKRYKRTGSLYDLARAIKVSEKAVEGSDRAGLARCLSNLGNILSERHKQTGSMDDLLRAIDEAEKAVEAAKDDRNVASYLMNLGNRIIELYERTRSKDDLTRAIEVAQRAVEVAHRDHIYLAMYLRNLGNKLGRRYEQTGMKADQDAQLSAYVESWDAVSSPPSDRLRAAKSAADIFASRREWDEAYDLSRKAVLLLPKVSPRSLKQSDMQEMLGSTSGLATDAAATAINAGKPPSEVLSILELGRGVIAGLLIDTRGNLSDLRKTHPLLADRFEALREELDSASENSGSVAELPMVNRRHEASDEFDEVIEEIRAQHGFNDFLQPPSSESLTAAAESGPIVVINVSKYRCDAILVERNRIRLLEIPSFDLFKDLENMEGSKHNPWPLLAWLWTTLCRPCLDALGFTEPMGDGQWPHVWWVPTGPLTLLPVHAAGIYTVPDSKETVLDRVVSSYASSLKALQYGRKLQGGVVDVHEQQNDAVLIAMEQTEGQMSLPNARTEIDNVASLCPLLNLNARTPPRRKVDILEHLKDCKILHFAGHGESSSDPSRSRILLDDWKTDPLTVNDLRESWHQKGSAFLAYLSACSTGSNQGRGLLDEAIHLVSAFQLAGFRHVVGTLWEVSDPHCVDVATVLYQTLCDEGMTDEGVSHGLHRAVRKLRDDCFREGGKRDIVLVGEDEGQTPGSSVNTFWIPYIHYGA